LSSLIAKNPHRYAATGFFTFLAIGAYLRDVPLRLSAGETDLEPLLPDRWGASHPEHVVQHSLDESRRIATRQKEARRTRRVVTGPSGMTTTDAGVGESSAV
jgi:hypothetical protein